MENLALQSILDAELATGNTIVSTHIDYQCRTVVQLAKPFHDVYYATRWLPGIMMSEQNHPHDYEQLSTYQAEDAVLAAPYQPLGLLLERAALEGRLLPENSRAPRPQPWDPPSDEQLSSRMKRLAAVIEVEMKRLKCWSAQPPSPEAFRFRRAFAGDTMAFEQWIQFILLPRLRQDDGLPFKKPPTSQVSVYGVREWDGRDELQPLLHLLRVLDSQFQAPQKRYARPRLTAAQVLGLVSLLVVSLAWLWLLIAIARPVWRWITPADLPKEISVVYSVRTLSGNGWFGSILLQAKEPPDAPLEDHKITVNIFNPHRAMVVEPRDGKLWMRPLNSRDRTVFTARSLRNPLSDEEAAALFALVQRVSEAATRADLEGAAELPTMFRIRTPLEIQAGPGTLPLGWQIAGSIVFLAFLAVPAVLYVWILRR